MESEPEVLGRGEGVLPKSKATDKEHPPCDFLTFPDFLLTVILPAKVDLITGTLIEESLSCEVLSLGLLPFLSGTWSMLWAR